MKEKQFLKWMFVRAAVIILIYLVATMILRMTLDHTFEERCLNLTNQKQWYSDIEPFELEDLEVQLDGPDLIDSITFSERGDDIYWKVVPNMQGAGEVYVMVINKNTGNAIESGYFKIAKNGRIMDVSTGGFTHCREHQLCMVIMMAALTLLLWWGYVKSVREIRFSYQSIFCVGLGLWMTIIFLSMLFRYLRGSLMMELYNTLAGAASRFAFFTSPLILIFAILLTISNISLIRHEGFRFANVLGMILSFVMVFGFLFLTFFGGLISSGSEFQIDLWDTICETLETVYALLECFLIGAIICGTRAARHKPAYDKDYIVILGCKVQKDGSLYPLIRGRVDRAIRFYREQQNATGKKAVFIPSGGKGSDETISEGEAMERYLLSQGIEPEQIKAETESANTRQNMQFSKALMEEGAKAVFSTTNFHVFRSGIISRQVGFEPDGM